MTVDDAKLDLAVTVALAELVRQANLDEFNAPYLYDSLEPNKQGIDGHVDLRALCLAILTNGGAP